MLNTNFSDWPNFSKAEIEAVGRVLASNRVNYWTGQEGRQFEIEFAEFTHTKHAIALANGTVAIDLALHGLGIGSHNGGKATDEVIVTPRSFMASVSAIVNAGARPVFADVDRDSQNITASTVALALSSNTRAILCVHLAGWPCDMDALRDLVHDRNIKLIEDCAQAHGALYKSRPVGGLGDVAAWSFCQDKIMSTGGEGGMVTCNDTALWKKMWAFKDHGKNWDVVNKKSHQKGFRWLHESFGTNWRMTEMQAAIGRIQLARLPSWQAVRAQNAAELSVALSQFAGPDGWLRIPKPACAGCESACDYKLGCRHAYYKFYAFVRPENLPENYTRDMVIDAFNACGIPCFQGSCSEIYLEKAFEGTGLRPVQSLKAAKDLGENSLMFLVHPGVSYSGLKFNEMSERLRNKA